jgi:hypothetical protein
MLTHLVQLRCCLPSVVAVVAFTSIALTPSADVRAFAVGKIETFAIVPATPGFPEGVAVDGNRVYVSGPPRFGTAGTGPSAIQVYDRLSGVLGPVKE